MARAAAAIASAPVGWARRALRVYDDAIAGVVLDLDGDAVHRRDRLDGYWPTAVSADSMTASAPSNTAVATSETSARVGTGDEIMLSSICVATTTGLPAARALRVICFCSPGTFSTRHLHAQVAARHHEAVRRHR